MKSKNLRYLKPKERDTLKAITDYLEARQILYLRHSPSNVVGRKGEATFRRPRLSQLGAPDLIVWPGWQAKGKTLAFEVKVPGKRPTVDQIKWSGRAILAGIEYHLVSSLDEVIYFIEQALRWKTGIENETN